MKKRVAVLGATGSIGKSALDVISRNRDFFEVVLLSAHLKKDELDFLQKQHPSAVCVLSGGKDGERKLSDAIKNVKPCITVNGISGSAGLCPSLSVIEAGSDLALANKETVVMAGDLVFSLAKEKNVKIIPVDSEHSAVFKLTEAYPRDKITEIILTASGGPFRKLSIKEMEGVTIKDALSHPTWKMGKKITIDSASMANKGLEVIEACLFFNMPPEKIKVVIHPQSVVHSLIKLNNGVLYAQLSKPDMRRPIHDALFYPDTAPLDIDELDFDSLSLEFEKCDFIKFPMLKSAYTAAKKSRLYPCAYNAANEEAVFAFLSGKIDFTGIPEVVSAVLEKDWSAKSACLEVILKTDKDARAEAVKLIEKMS